MAALSRAMILMLVFASFASVALSTPGIATYYDTYVPSACYGFQDQGTMIAAVSADIFQNKAACGRMYRVRCTSSTNSIPACKGGSVLVKVVDLCPGCPRNGFDLSKQAFSTIANLDAGRINIDYNRA